MSGKTAARCPVLGLEPPSDPFPTYERARAAGPVVWSDTLHSWAVLGHHVGREVLRDDSFLMDPLFKKALPRLVEATGHDFATLRDIYNYTTFFLDPPEHGPARKVMTGLVMRWPVSILRPPVEQLIERLLQRARRDGGFDLVRDFARPIPASVVAHLFGIPSEDVLELTNNTETFVRLFDGAISLRDYRRIDDAARATTEYFAATIRQRRAAPREDGLSYMIRAADEQQGIGDDALAGYCSVLFGAGFETTASFISAGAATLFQNPAAVAELRTDPAKLPTAAEDLLRYQSPVQSLGRVASEDRVVSGTKIPTGDRLVVYIGAANRDPAIWPSGPCPALNGTLPSHLAFGDGRHFCLGAQIARMEGIAAFAGLLTLPRISFDLDHAVWTNRRTFRALSTLPVTL